MGNLGFGFGQLDLASFIGRAAQLLALGLLIVTATACGQPSRPECFLEIPVYDARGNRLPFAIDKAIVKRSEGEEVDLLTIQQEEYRVTADGHRLYFAPKLIGVGPVKVRLEYAKDFRRKRWLETWLTACRQRRSLHDGVVGSVPPGGIVAWTTVNGMFAGCDFEGDWWLRAMPMFGESEGSETYEGYVQPDGRFMLDLSYGVRHLFVVGKGKNPVKVFAFDVTKGGITENEIGQIDLTGLCPP